MAKRRRAATGTKVIQIRERASAPVIKVSAPRATPIKKHRRRRSHSGGHSRGIGGGATGAMSATRSGALALGGFIYGYIEKNVPQFPTLPVVGKSGAIALAAYFLGGKNAGLIADVGNAASVIAGYSFGATGKVSGLAPQVSGLAAQI